MKENQTEQGKREAEKCEAGTAEDMENTERTFFQKY